MKKLKEQIVNAISGSGTSTATTKNGTEITITFDRDNRRCEGDELDGRYAYHFEITFGEEVLEDWSDDYDNIIGTALFFLKRIV